MQEYKNGNKNASDILLHGFQMNNSIYISSDIIDKALRGDEEAKQIVYAQIDTLRCVSNHSHTDTRVVVPFTTGKK